MASELLAKEVVDSLETHPAKRTSFLSSVGLRDLQERGAVISTKHLIVFTDIC